MAGRILAVCSLLLSIFAAVPLHATEPARPGIPEILAEARALRRDGQFLGAEIKLREGLGLARESGNREAEAAIRFELAGISMERFEGLANYRLALKLCRALGDHRGEAAALRGMGETYVGAGFGIKAIEILTPTLELARKLEEGEAVTEIHRALGSAHQSLGSLEEALDHFEQGLEDREGLPLARIGGLLRLATLEQALGRNEAALPRLQEAAAILQKETPPGDVSRLFAPFAEELQKDPLAEAMLGELAVPADPELLRTKLEIFAEELEARSAIKAIAGRAAPPDDQTARRSRFLETLGLQEARALRSQWVTKVSSDLREQMRENRIEPGDLILWSAHFSHWLGEEAARFEQDLLDSGLVSSLPAEWPSERDEELAGVLTREGFSREIATEVLHWEVPEQTASLPASSAARRDAGSEDKLLAQILLYLQDPRKKEPDFAAFLQGFDELGSRLRRFAGGLLGEALSGDAALQGLPRTIQYRSCALGTYVLLGRTYADLGRPEVAATWYEKAWDIFPGLVLPALEPAAAREALRDPLSAKDLGFPPPLAWTARCLNHGGGGPAFSLLPLSSPAHGALWEGEVSLARGEYEMALFHFRDALSAANLEARAAALTGIGSAYERQGRKTLALKSYWAAFDTVEDIQGTIRLDQLAMPFAGRQRPLYERAIRVLADLGEAEFAFEDAERARARILLNKIGHRKLRSRRIPPELADEWYALKQRLAELQARREASKGDAELPAEQEAVHVQFEAVLDKIRLLDPEFAASVSVDVVSVREIQTRILDTDTTLVEYFVLEDHTLAWIIDRNQVRMVRLGIGSSGLARKVRYLTDLITARRATQEDSAQLRDEIFTPLEPHLLHRSLVIVPHGPLHALPFGALWDSATDRFLVQDYRIVYAPSASVLRFLRSRRNTFQGHALVLGDPGGSLPEAAREARAVASLYGSEPLLGSEAREDRIHESARVLDVLHVAAHAVYDAARPLLTRFNLAPGAAASRPSDERSDGHLNLYEIYDLDLAEANLVVLSACATAQGSPSGGDEIVSLGRAFLYAGAPAIVTSLWKLDDAGSAFLMESFHRHLRAGLDAASALQAAQLDALASPDWKEPFFWAPFALTGDSGASLRPGR